MVCYSHEVCDEEIDQTWSGIRDELLVAASTLDHDAKGFEMSRPGGKCSLLDLGPGVSYVRSVNMVQIFTSDSKRPLMAAIIKSPVSNPFTLRKMRSGCLAIILFTSAIAFWKCSNTRCV